MKSYFSHIVGKWTCKEPSRHNYYKSKSVFHAGWACPAIDWILWQLLGINKCELNIITLAYYNESIDWILRQLLGINKCES